MIRIHSVLLPALIYRGLPSQPPPPPQPPPPSQNTHTHTGTARRSKGPRSIDEPNEESSCFSAYLLNSISPTRSSVYLPVHLSAHLSICPSLFFFFLYILSPGYPSICPSHPPPPRRLNLSLCPSIYHSTSKQRYQRDRCSFQLTRLVLVMHSRFIYFAGN